MALGQNMITIRYLEDRDSYPAGHTMEVNRRTALRLVKNGKAEIIGDTAMQDRMMRPEGADQTAGLTGTGVDPRIYGNPFAPMPASGQAQGGNLDKRFRQEQQQGQKGGGGQKQGGQQQK